MKKYFGIGLLLPLLILSKAVVFAEEKTAEEEEGEKLEEIGIDWTRAGGIVNLRLEGNKFVLYFADADRKPIEADFPTAIVRYEGVSKKDKEDTVKLKLAADKKHLASPRFIRPPHDYFVTVLLLDKEKNKRESLKRQRIKM